MNRRVVISGIGVIAPNGIGKENFWHSVINGKSRIVEEFLGKVFKWWTSSEIL